MNATIEQIREVLGPWGFAFAVLAAAVTLAAVIQWLVYRALRYAGTREKALAEKAFLDRTNRSTRALAWVLGAFAALPVFPLSPEGHATAVQVVRALAIAAITWVIISAVAVIDELIFARYDISVKDNLKARRMHTRARVLTRTAMLIIGIAGGAAVLMSFPAMRQVGAGLLASAGIVGVAVGFAAKPTLGNIIAGLQIAITEPIRLDDAVIVDGEWGWIEEITTTYVVVKIWDQRRLIVPLSRFIEQPFQNWTRTRADIIGSVELFVDYTCPMDEMRAELDRLLETNERWDRRVKVLQVIDATERTMKLRALMSAGDSPTAWDLRCEVREGLIRFLQREHPGALPREREVHERSPSKPAERVEHHDEIAPGDADSGGVWDEAPPPPPPVHPTTPPPAPPSAPAGDA